MVRTRACRQWTIGLAVAALLLQAAVPLLAATAARLRGVPVAEVCDVYGVRTLLASPSHDHASHHGDAGHDAPPAKGQGSHAAASEGAAHCALAALTALAAGHAPALHPQRAGPGDGRVQALATAFCHDAAARWVARLKHGPPAAG